MGQMIYDPVGGKYVYQPDWWEQAASAVATPFGRMAPSQQRQSDYMAGVPGPGAGGGMLDPLLENPTMNPGVHGSGPSPAPTGPNPSEGGPMGNGEIFAPPLGATPGSPPSPFGPAPGPAGGGYASASEDFDALRRANAGGGASDPFGGAGLPGGGYASGAEDADALRRGGAGAPAGGLGSGLPGGGGYASGSEDADALRRANGGSASGASGGMGGNPDFFSTIGVNDMLYADPQTGMRRSLRQGGVNPDTNPFAQAALARFSGPIMQALYDFWEVLNGGAGDQAETMPEFLRQFMAGQINPTALMQQAQAKMAGGDEDMSQMLEDLGPEGYTEITQRARGSTKRVADARKTTMARKVGRQKEDALDHPNDYTTRDWLKLIGGR